MKRLNKKIFPGKYAMKTLKIGLPMISASLVALALEFHAASERSPLTAFITYPDMFSRILGSLLLLIFAAMIFDFAEME